MKKIIYKCPVCGKKILFWRIYKKHLIKYINDGSTRQIFREDEL